MTLSVEQKITDLLIEIRLQLEVDFVGLAMAAENADGEVVIKWKYVSNNRNNRYQKIVLQVGKGIAGIVWKTARPYVIEDAKKDIQETKDFPLTITEQLVSMAAIPLLNGHEVQAVLLGGFRKKKKLNQEFIDQLISLCTEINPLLLEVRG
ncbi:GAF domain-containing protein [Niallia circulans]|uniref:GAF domain-containing protein n=1 Tax=Niallia circulans TaxID=1397 RepID=A0A553SSL2_NIACI|nr:GAF domain-containing protein [Niallia circulans]TRZ39993.1 GAF domain-containing protein [Niallia circulans]